MTLEQDRAKLSGLHFAKEALSEHERETLYLAESLLRRLDAILVLHHEAPVPENGFTQGWGMTWCARDHEHWPCATVRASEEEDR